MTNVQELKATAYDLIANITFLENKLREINNQIAEESKKLYENGSASSNDSN
jgi:hypothetical protein